MTKALTVLFCAVIYTFVPFVITIVAYDKGAPTLVFVFVLVTVGALWWGVTDGIEWATHERVDDHRCASVSSPRGTEAESSQEED